MRSQTLSKVILAATISAAGLAAASPAFAGGRCGGALAVDAPTTLSKVARKCNVRLSALREANPGVDPANVRPGEHLSIPIERDQFVGGSSFVIADQDADDSREDVSVVVADDEGMTSINLEDFRSNPVRRTDRINVRDTRVSREATSRLRPEPVSAGGYSANNRLSFQKLSAARIHNAGVQLVPVTSTSSNEGVLPARFTSPTPLLRDYNLPDYSRIGVTPKAIKVDEKFTLSGQVVENDSGCIILKTSDNYLWRLAAPSPSNDLVGKKVTVWGTAVEGKTCGGGAAMLVSHAVYAEPWVVE